MPNLFALLVGINDYQQNSQGSVPNLTGCVNDIKIFEAYLKKRFPKEQQRIVRLLNEEATYEAVVKNFGPAHLEQAGPDDVVVFAYSGHGSREQAPTEFAPYFPEGMMETLVLADSRQPGGLDLADKELAVLIDRIAGKGAHVTVLLDCCHSGSGTRNLDDYQLGQSRQASDRQTPRQLGELLHGHFTKNKKDLHLPAGRHVLLAACDKREKAHETKNSRGLFSTILMGVLNETQYQRGISYTQLFTECRIRAAKAANLQHPQLETFGYFNGLQGFLGLGSPTPSAPVKVYFKDGQWNVTMGATSGLPTTKTQPATFEILKQGQVIGQAKSRTVGVEESSLELDFVADENQTYDARLTSTPEPPMLVELVADKNLTKAAKAAAANFKPLYFGLETGLLSPGYSLVCEATEFKILRNADGLALRTLQGNDHEAMFKDILEKLDLVARWEKTVQLDNAGSRLQKNEVELVLSELDESGKVVFQHTGNEAIVEVTKLNGREIPVPFKLEIRNNSVKPRHCALLYGDEDYRLLYAGYNDEVPAGKSAIALEDVFEVGEGKQNSVSILKLLVSNQPIHPELLELKETFKLGETVSSFWKGKGAATRSAEAPRTRSIGRFKQPETAVDEDQQDWFSVTLRVNCVAQEAGVGQKMLSLADDFIKILPHSSFRSGVSLNAVYPGSRSTEEMAVLTEIAQANGVEMLAFGNGTRAASPVNMLELTGIQNEESLQDEPLKIELASQLKSNADVEETLLPMTFDGEFLIPIGTTERLENGNTLVSISQLPDTQEVRRRSLGKALKMCFLKLVLKKENVQYLRWVDYSGEKAERRSEGLRGKVANAENILLLLHGIIGDTQGMADFAKPIFKTGKRRGKNFDLVLTFDYENLNTPIEETAGKLANLLRDEAGLTPGSGKQVTILAHSMGGLVSRYFIQNFGGDQLVQHLVMAGTPNGGSALAKLTTYRDYAIPILTLLVNLPWGIPAAATVLGVLKQSKKVTKTLSQMDYDNDGFLKNLNKGSLRGVRCSVVAGHLDRYLLKNTGHQKLMDRAYKLGGKLFYAKEPNDIAVSVANIQLLPTGQVVKVMEVDCHHLCYFEEGGSVGVLDKLLKGGF